MGNRGKHCRTGGLVVSIHAPQAREVAVAGTFNDWSMEANRLKRTGDGHWVATLDLPPGRYEYKFIVDGEWSCDTGCDKPYDGCPGCVPNQFGTMNRLLVVEDAERLTSERRQLA